MEVESGICHGIGEKLTIVISVRFHDTVNVYNQFHGN